MTGDFAFFTPKEKFYDKNSRDLSQEFHCYVLLAKETSFDLLSRCHLWKRLKDRLTVKQGIFQLLAGQMENILNLTSIE